MATFTDPASDAQEASTAWRGLAHATRSIDDPHQMYQLLGELLDSTRSLHQVLDQIARAHLHHGNHASDDHDHHSPGLRDAMTTAEQLHQAASMTDRANTGIDAAMSAAGRIAWQPTALDPDAAGASRQRWISVVFLQGQDADEVLEVLDREGPGPAQEYLKNWDYGDETTDAAMSDGHVYDEIPATSTSHARVEGDYAMTYDPAFGHIGLYRRHDVAAEDALDDPAPSSVERSHAPARRQPAPAQSWVDPVRPSASHAVGRMSL